jgi:site-specific recombinase XerD
MIEDLRIRNYSPLFLYRTSLEKDWRVEHIPHPRQEKRLPEVLSPTEVSKFPMLIPG